ncbi:MAG: ABC transporter permease [Acidobacteria bacterium]|nr:ABC transporter permease [Acidobacteriota bacterium]
MPQPIFPTRFGFWRWLILFIGLIVPHRLRADWRQEWEAELRWRELQLAEWDSLNLKNKFDLFRHSLGAFWDAVQLQPRRLEDEMFQDLRYGARMLLKGKAFTAVAVLSLALGIGANTAIFSLVDALLLRSLPVKSPEQLVLFGHAESAGLTVGFPDQSCDLFSYPFYQAVRQQREVFSEATALQSFPNGVHGVVNLNGTAGEAELIVSQPVSGTYFMTLGVNAAAGRVFTEADDQTPGAHPVVVLNHRWWEKRFGGNPAVIGQTITISKTTYTIIGVAAKEFFGTTVGQTPDLWVPLAMEEQLPPYYWKGRSKPLFQSLHLIARLKDGVSTQQAQNAINLLFKQNLREIAGAQPSEEKLRNIQTARIELTSAGSGISELRRQFSLPLRILLAVVAVVLLIACANVANLLLARATARASEFAVRLALGSTRARLIRQLLTESLLLASLGGALGILFAWWGSRLLLRMVNSGSEPLSLDVSPDARVLGFTLLISMLSAIMFGAVPALRATQVELNPVLKGGGKGTATAVSRSLFGKTLVVAQVALSLLLLVGAGLFVRTLINLQNVPTGFHQQNVLVLQIDTSASGYKEDAQFSELLHTVEEKVMALPGVRAASFSMFLFNQGGWSGAAFTRDSTSTKSQAQDSGNSISNNVVGLNFFTALDLPLLQGRTFGPQDTAQSSRVAIISQTMAQQFFPNQSPLGKRFSMNPDFKDEFEIIGVVRDAKYGSLDEAPRPMAYYPNTQNHTYLNNFEVRFSGSPDALVPAIRRAIKEANRNLPIDEVATLSDHIDRSLVQQRLIAKLSAFFGLTALLLACIGLYGILSYAVARRSHEIGIRMALGAQAGNVLWLVMREALMLVIIGLVVGLIASLVLTQMTSSLLFGLTPSDPLTIAMAVTVLIAIAALAGYLPARRATKFDPLTALRHE